MVLLDAVTWAIWSEGSGGSGGGMCDVLNNCCFKLKIAMVLHSDAFRGELVLCLTLNHALLLERK